MPLMTGRFVVTVGRTIAGAPFVDPCMTVGRDEHGTEMWRAHGWAIRPRPTAGRVLVIARIGGIPPMPPRRLRGWGPFAMRHGGWSHWSPRRIAWRADRRPFLVLAEAYAAVPLDVSGHECPN